MQYKKQNTPLLLFILLITVLSSCDKKVSYEGRIIKDYKWKAIKHFSIEENCVTTAKANDSCIVLTVCNKIKKFDYSGHLLETIVPDSTNYICSYDEEGSHYWVNDDNSREVKYYNKNNKLLKRQLIDTQSRIQYFGRNRFIVPDLDEKKNIYTMTLYDAIKDTVLKEINICKLTGVLDTIPVRGGSITFTNSFCKNEKGQVLAYYRYNSSFIFIDTSFVATAYQDFRKLPVGIPSLKGHNVLLNPINCGIDCAAMDDKFIYLVTPTYQCKQWKKSENNRMLDVYDICTKKYIGSMKLPISKGKSVFSIAKTAKGFVVFYVGNYSGIEIVIFKNDFTNLFN